MTRDETCSRFLDSLAFSPYPFQEEALLAWFETDTGVLVSAPTGMGKTLIAEAALYEALASHRRLYYTTPLIALTDQKFREFQDKAEQWGFARADIGLITGNRRINPDARVRVVVAEILLNHLLAEEERFDDVQAVVMDEFHSFNDLERGIVWELSLVLLPRAIRLMLLSATVGNPVEFLAWLRESHGRSLRLVTSSERRVPLEYVWVGDKLLTELLPAMVGEDDASSRVPALVFCFNRDECWELAERLKGLPLIDARQRAAIEERLSEADLTAGIGPKLRNMLIRGVGVHHAGVLPRHKELVEELFLKKLTPFVVCTETLAAGINLPARSVVVTTLLKGKRGERKLVFASAAHQMFGRAGRPQFDTRGYVYAVAHEDDVKIEKWRRKYEQIDRQSKDPGILRIRKDLERKRPTRRKTEEYWTEGQFHTLIKAGPAHLASRTMIPYHVLIFLLTQMGSLRAARDFLGKRFNTAERLATYQDQLGHMVRNLEAFGYLKRGEAEDQVTLESVISTLLTFRSVDPLYGAFLAKELAHSDLREKVIALESLLPLPPAMRRGIALPEDLEPGPLQKNRLEPLLISMGVVVAQPQPASEDRERARSIADFWDADEEGESDQPPTFPDMLRLVYESRLASPEEVLVQAKWIAGGLLEQEPDFYKFTKARNLSKNEGLVLRHLLRLVILAGEFHTLTEDPEYQDIGRKVTEVCRQVDPTYTDRFLASEQEAHTLPV
jgi:superfamily II DNA/RNA helicase